LAKDSLLDRFDVDDDIRQFGQGRSRGPGIQYGDACPNHISGVARHQR
jgi:hypothetical protein